MSSARSSRNGGPSIPQPERNSTASTTPRWTVPRPANTGMQHSDLVGTFTQQDVSLDELFMDRTIYDERVMSGAHMESVADLAIRTALSSRGVAHITIPVDIQAQEMKKGRSERNPVITHPQWSLGTSWLCRILRSSMAARTLDKGSIVPRFTPTGKIFTAWGFLNSFRRVPSWHSAVS